MSPVEEHVVGSNPIPNASVVGISVGLVAGAVLVALGGVFLWRRRKQGKAPFGPRGSQRSGRVYPESAWLYDPQITPPRSRAGSTAEAALLPDPRAGSVEMAAGGLSPNMRPARPSSPLLAPHITITRDESPGYSPFGGSGETGRSSRYAGTDNLRRPLTSADDEGA